MPYIVMYMEHDQPVFGRYDRTLDVRVHSASEASKYPTREDAARFLEAFIERGDVVITTPETYDEDFAIAKMEEKIT